MKYLPNAFDLEVADKLERTGDEYLISLSIQIRDTSIPKQSVYRHIVNTLILMQKDCRIQSNGCDNEKDI